MAYLGRQPVLGNFVKLDSITVVNGQAAYTMQNGGVNFTDYTTVNQFLVSLNGTIQAATDSFTVSGSTITFASNLSTGDVIDFIIVFGNSLSAGTVSDSAITTAKLADSSVSLAKLTATGTKDATTFLRGDNTFAEAGGGKVLQVVNGTVGSTSMANTDDYIGAGLSITPTSTSSKIQIFVAGYVEKGGGGAVGNYAELQMRENTTAITTLNNAIQYLYTVGARQNFSINFTRSPNTTSAVQYRLYHNEISGGATYIYYQQAWTLMEIEG